MKKKIVILTIILTTLLFITGCDKKEKNEEKNNNTTGGWEILLTSNTEMLDDETIKIFNDATSKYTKEKLEYVALLGEQVVAGKNYMFLAKGYKKGEEDNATYKVVVIYNDLEDKSSVTSVSEFDITEYTNKNISDSSEDVVGGWEVEIPGKPIMLDEEVQIIFDNATLDTQGISYYPIATLGKQIVSGTNYAVLCFGRKEDGKEGIYLLTLYEDLSNRRELISEAYIDLSHYNR